MYSTKILSLVVLLTSLTLQACGGGDGSTPGPDTVKPVITLNGDANLSIVEGTAYTEANATAVDTVDGSVAVVISGTVGSDAGVYNRRGCCRQLC